MSNARSKKWKMRHVRPNDTFRLVKKVVGCLPKANPIPWTNIKYGQLVAVYNDITYAGFAALLPSGYVRFYGPFAGQYINESVYNPKCWINGSCFDLHSWSGYYYPKNPIVIADNLEKDLSAKEVYGVVMGILNGTNAL